VTWGEELAAMQARQEERTKAEHTDVEFIDVPHDAPAPLAIRHEAAPVVPSFFAAIRPSEKVAFAAEVADALKPILTSKHLTHKLNRQNPDDEYVELEGWQTCANLCGLSCKIDWTRPLANGYEARASVVRVDTGIEVGSGESMCTRAEKTWANRDDYALRGMAATRAQSRALRGVLAWVLVLAGYKATPAEEMPPREPAKGQEQVNRQAADSPSAISDIARKAFEIAVRLKVIPDDKVVFRQYCLEKYPGLDWPARLKALEALDALADEGEVGEMSSAFSQVEAEATHVVGETTHRKLELRVLAICSHLKIDEARRHEISKHRYARESLRDLTEEQLREFAEALEQGKAA
jgi:hypothetical protein